MWRCVSCGKENRDDRTHCWHCSTGKDASPSEVTLTAQTAENPSNVDGIPKACPNCSSPLDVDAKFCPSCATPILLYSTLTCPKCGKSVSASAKFCKYCAADLTQKDQYDSRPQVATTYTTPSYQSFGEVNIDRFLAIGAVVLVLSILGYLWGSSYISNNMLRAGFAGLMGRPTPMYTFAVWVANLSMLGGLVGLILTVLGLVRQFDK
jgi:RNA polymerase subunit RPABC4/transcription elongation factor Spt4